MTAVEDSREIGRAQSKAYLSVRPQTEFCIHFGEEAPPNFILHLDNVGNSPSRNCICVGYLRFKSKSGQGFFEMPVRTVPIDLGAQGQKSIHFIATDAEMLDLYSYIVNDGLEAQHEFCGTLLITFTDIFLDQNKISVSLKGYTTNNYRTGPDNIDRLTTLYVHYEMEVSLIT